MKKEKGVSGLTIICVFLLFAMLMFYGTFYIVNKVPSTKEYFSEYNKTIKNELKETIAEQSTMNEKIEDISENGEYTIDNPCILTNPYKINDLSAILIFSTSKKTSITVSINGNSKFKSAKTDKHIIPIYGLYANTSNIIGLEDEDGVYKEVEIQTETYNNNLGDTDITPIIDGKQALFLYGSPEEKDILRVFDQDKNMIMYLDYGYIGGYKVNEETINILYNEENTSKTSMPYINVEMDFLGRIIKVSESQADIISDKNYIIGDIAYAYQATNIYPKNMSTYQTGDVIYDESYTKPITINTSTVSDILVSSETYTDEYKLSVNDDYVTFDFYDSNVSMLLLVEKDSKYTYSYDIKDKNMIKVEKKNKYALYVIKDDKYYNLLSTIEI